MAIATASAIALGGMAISAGTAGMSFAQAGKQKSLQAQAERDAQASFDAARKDLGKNYYQAIGIQKEPYELSREGLLSSSYGLTQAAQESERGAAEAAGRIYLASQQGQGQVRTEQGQEMLNLEKLTAQENSRLRDIGVGLNLDQAAGYQQMAADAQKAAANATEQGMKSATDAAMTGVKELVPLYFKQKGLDPLTGLPLAKTATPTTATNNFVMQDRQNKPLDNTYDMLKQNPSFNMMNYPPPQNPLVNENQVEENPYLRNYKFNNYNPFQPY